MLLVKGNDINANYWQYELPDGFEALAGKTDLDNEILSLRLAAPNDLWFHAHGVSGSHVILRHPERIKPDKTIIKIAAALAAWHSKARNAGTVPVCYTEAKNVGKPRGAKPGSVTATRERTIKVRPALPSI